MIPLIHSGELCTIAPVPKDWIPTKDQIVLCKVVGNYYLHLISAVSKGRVQISNNHGRVNGWTHLSNVFGILTDVQP